MRAFYNINIQDRLEWRNKIYVADPNHGFDDGRMYLTSAKKGHNLLNALFSHFTCNNQYKQSKIHRKNK